VERKCISKSVRSDHEIPESKVFTTRKQNQQVWVICPQHSSCTWFTMLLCSTMNSNAKCIPDFPHCGKPIPVVQNGVVKTTILATGDPFAPVKHIPNRLYRIAYFKHPAEMLRSVKREGWRDNCGGMRRKFSAVDRFARRIFDGNISVDALLFAEDVFLRGPALLHSMGFPAFRERVLSPSPRNESNFATDKLTCEWMPFLCKLYKV